MADAGSTQERLKTELETKLEIRSIERDLKKLDQERLAAQADYVSGQDTIQQKLEIEYDELEKQYELSKVLAEEALKQSHRIITEKSAKRKRDAQNIFAEVKREQDLNKKAIRDFQENISLLRSRLRFERVVLDEQQKQYETIQAFIGKLGGVFQRQQNIYKVIRDSKVVSAGSLVVWSSILAVIGEVWEVFKKVDEGLAKFRIHMGLLRPDMERLKKDMLSVATELAKVGVNIEGVAAATISLGNEFGSVHVLSKDLIETTSVLKAQLGVAEDSSAGFLRNMAALSKTTAQTQRYMAYVASEITSAAGVPLNLVMQDVAKMSGNALGLVSRIPLQIVKAAVEARKLGTTINKMADASASILNFTENVQAEMEASVLVGTAINLQLARQLAYQRDIVKSTKAIIAEARRIDFENLDFFQMQAFAAATGRSVDELMKMVVAERQLREARGMKELKDEVALIDKMTNSREADLKNQAIQRELTVKQMANQERLAALQQQWNQLMMEATVVLYPFIDGFIKLAMIGVKLLPVFGSFVGFVVTLNSIEGVLKKIGFSLITFSKGASVLSDIGIKLAFFGSKFSKITLISGKILGVFGSLVGLVSKLGPLFSLATPFLKAIPIIGWVISAFQFIYRLSVRWQEYVGKDGLIVGGIKAIGMSLYDVLLKPFKDVFEWVMKWLGGHSPSYIGLSIVKGIASVGAKIFDALSWPWRKFLAWVVQKIPFMGGIANKIRGGITGAIEGTDFGNTKATIVTESTSGVKPETATQAAKTTEFQTKRDQDSVTLGEILKSLKTLNDNLMSGKIGIYIDGQLMSATLARQTAFRGGYGTNQVNMG